MSAGASDTALMVNRDLSRLAPLFAARVRAAIDTCNDGPDGGLRAMVYEGYRTQQLQALYYQRGRTIIPPTRPVTYAPTSLHSWHGFGLAVDVVHRERFWEPPQGLAWFGLVADIFKRHECNWGGDWTKPDAPHFQWGRCPPSPSDGIRSMQLAAGLDAVWAAMKAS